MQHPDAESLNFPLQVEDGWPPVPVECLPCRRTDTGFEILAAPLFVHGISVGDVIAVRSGSDGSIEAWRHVHKSKRTTVWLLQVAVAPVIDGALARLRTLGCNSVGLQSWGCFAVDVPESVSLGDVDAILAELDEGSVAVAFPSLRHDG